MKKYITRLLALALCAVMLLGALAGCNKDNTPSNKDNASGGNANYDVAEIAGTILLNVNACVEISYDKEGRVLNVQEVDHDGHELLADYAGYLETSCEEVVKELTEISKHIAHCHFIRLFIRVGKQKLDRLCSVADSSRCIDLGRDPVAYKA